MSFRKYGYRTIHSTKPAGTLAFDPTVKFGTIGGGQLDMTRWGEKFADFFDLYVAFAFSCDTSDTFEGELAMEDPTIPARRVILATAAFDGSAPAFNSFYDDNLGQGYPVPYRNGQPNVPWEVTFETGNLVDPVAVFTVELWWVPRWPDPKVFADYCRAMEKLAR